MEKAHAKAKLEIEQRSPRPAEDILDVVVR
jgi:hypothetical protein